LLAQAESGKLTLVKDTVEMDSLVFEVLQQMRVLAKDRLRLSLARSIRSWYAATKTV